MINDLVADFGDPVYVCLPRTEVASLDHIIKEPINVVTVVLVVLCRIDSSLGSNRVRPSGRILVTEDLDIITQFSE